MDSIIDILLRTLKKYFWFLLKAKETKECWWWWFSRVLPIVTNEDTFMLWAVSWFGGAGSWGRLGRYINCPLLCCNFRRRFFVSLAFSFYKEQVAQCGFAYYFKKLSWDPLFWRPPRSAHKCIIGCGVPSMLTLFFTRPEKRGAKFDGTRGVIAYVK
jgi:hypothetical protein